MTIKNEEMEKHGYIRFAGAKTVWIIGLWLTGLFLILFWEKLTTIQRTPLVGLLTVLILWTRAFLLQTSFTSWFRNYWDRNVRGYSAIHWLDNDGAIRSQISHKSGSKLFWEPDGYTFVELSLGGWFKRSRVFSEDRFLDEWRIQKVWWKDKPDCSHVGKSELPPQELLRLVTLSPYGDYLKKLAKVADDHERLIQQLDEAITEALATSRLSNSKEGKKLIRGLCRALLEILPSNDPRRGKYYNLYVIPAA